MPESPVTGLLIEARTDAQGALDRLAPLLYADLRRAAHLRLRRERDDHTLSTTALVHEAYLRLVDQTRVRFEDRSHFLAVATVAMRRVLVDHARARLTDKRRAEHVPLELGDGAAAAAAYDERPELVLELDEALTRLARFDARLARVVECRYFGGLSEEETAEVIGTTARTVRRDWVKARGWLYDALRP